jgi:hypothetical protein
MKIRIFSDIKVNFINSEDILKKNVIYKLTFPNGKVYIGQTSQLLRERVRQHCSDAFNKESHTPKGRAIRKYLSLNIEVLYQGDELDYNEINYIKEYNSTNQEYGYNLESGGNLNKIVSEETRRKLSESNKGRIVSEETKDKIRGVNNPNAKSIIVTDIKTGIETKFGCIKEAAEYFDIKYKNISEVISGRSKTFKKKQYTARYE